MDNIDSGVIFEKGVIRVSVLQLRQLVFELTDCYNIPNNSLIDISQPLFFGESLHFSRWCDLDG